MFKDKKEKVGLYKDFDKKDKTTIDQQEEKEKYEEQEEKEKKKKKKQLSQEQFILLRASIFRIGADDLPVRDLEGATDAFIKELLESSPQTRERYFAQVEIRAKLEGVSEYDIMAEDAIQIRKANMSGGDVSIDPTTGRLDICSQNGVTMVQDGEELDKSYVILDNDSDGGFDGDTGTGGDGDTGDDGDGGDGDEDEDEYYL